LLAGQPATRLRQRATISRVGEPANLLVILLKWHCVEGRALGSFLHWIFTALLTTPFPAMVMAFAPGYIFLFFCGTMVL